MGNSTIEMKRSQGDARRLAAETETRDSCHAFGISRAGGVGEDRLSGMIRLVHWMPVVA